MSAMEPAGLPAPRFSVVLVNYNGLDWTRRAVESVLAQQGVTAEVIVVDNGSTDGSLEEIVALSGSGPGSPVRVLPQGENIGFAAACNRGFAAARGPFIVQLNNDAELEPGALARAQQVLGDRPEAGSLALSMRFKDRPHLLNSTGLLLFRDGSAKDRDFEVEVAAGPREVEPVLGACGGAAVWRREVFDRVGMLDEEFFMYSEDLDMALRAQRAGFACLYVPDAVVLHRFGASVAREPADWRMEMAHRNTARVLMRNLGPVARARGVVTFAARVVTLRARGGRAEARARAKALAFLVRNRRKLGAQRRRIRALGPDRRVDEWLQRPRGG